MPPRASASWTGQPKVLLHKHASSLLQSADVSYQSCSDTQVVAIFIAKHVVQWVCKRQAWMYDTITCLCASPGGRQTLGWGLRKLIDTNREGGTRAAYSSVSWRGCQFQTQSSLCVKVCDFIVLIVLIVLRLRIEQSTRYKRHSVIRKIGMSTENQYLICLFSVDTVMFPISIVHCITYFSTRGG